MTPPSEKESNKGGRDIVEEVIYGRTIAEDIQKAERRRVVAEIRNRLKDYVHKFESEFINGEDMLAIEWKDLEKILAEIENG